MNLKSSTIGCIIDNDTQIALAQEAVVLQTSEASLHMPCHAGGDSASVSSGELAVTVVSAVPALKGDNLKVPDTVVQVTTPIVPVCDMCEKRF